MPGVRPHLLWKPSDRTQYVEYRGRGFWAYDVALGILLKHVIDIAEPLAATPDSEWLVSALSDWRVPAAISDYGLEIDKNWSPAQLSGVRKLV